MRDQYMLLGQSFMLVYSLTDRASFEGVAAFHQQIIRVKGTPKVPMVLCGNKSDLVEERAIPYAEGSSYSASLEIPFFEVSAKTKQNVVEAFQELLKVLLLDDKNKGQSAVVKKRRGGCALL